MNVFSVADIHDTLEAGEEKGNAREASFQRRNEVYGIRDHSPEIEDHSFRILNHKSQDHSVGSGIRLSHLFLGGFLAKTGFTDEKKYRVTTLSYVLRKKYVNICQQRGRQRT